MAFSITRSSSITPLVKSYPVVALREGVVFPNTEAHLTFGRPQSTTAVEAAIKGDKQVDFVAQKNPVANPELTDLYQIGSLSTIEQVAPSGNEFWAVVRGAKRVTIGPYLSVNPYLSASVTD